MRNVRIDDVVHAVISYEPDEDFRHGGRTTCDHYEWFSKATFDVTRNVWVTDQKVSCLMCLARAG